MITTYIPDAFLVVMSVDDTASMETAEINLQFLNNLGLLREKTIVLVANKSDLVRNRVIKSAQGKSLAQKYGVKYIETSPGKIIKIV